MNKLPERYIYPAIFSYADDGINISFPDLKGCYSCAWSQDECVDMARDALAGYLALSERDGSHIPAPSDIRSIETADGDVVTLIEAFMPPYRETSVRKNLTLPALLVYEAERAGINFSQFMAEALERYLHPEKNADEGTASGISSTAA